ncbi:MAG: (deoxy)nucleoside triphosphate pyrophosphohydrolase [Sphingomonadales bacterium]|nr:(deoxy)nucleoside triphosphate pyrophosphohydrolase [Sphingomonadales bacterium]
MPEIPTLIPVVAAALVRTDGAVLLQKRRSGSVHGGLWEFPGGKVEPGESPEMALIREIAEELGITLVPESLEPVAFASDPAQPPLPRAPHLILLYACRSWAGNPLCLDADALEWFTPGQFAGLAMPPLDVPLAIALEKWILSLANPVRHP